MKRLAIVSNSNMVLIMILLLLMGSPVGLGKAYGQAKPPTEDLDYGLDTEQIEAGGEVVGGAVNIIAGNLVEVRRDLDLPSANRLGFRFEAFYNSRSDVPGALGYGWRHTYELALIFSPPSTGADLKIIDAMGRGHYFLWDQVSGVYKGMFKDNTSVSLSGGLYVWSLLDGSTRTFSAQGYLTCLTDQVGNKINVTEYASQGKPKTLQDASTGRAITLRYDQGLLARIEGPVTKEVADGVWVRYTRTGSTDTVTYADAQGSGYRYTYGGSDGHNLYQKRNAASHLIAQGTYDAQDRCTGYWRRDGKGASLISYNAPTSQVAVRDAYGKERSYQLASFGGRMRVSSVSGPANAPYSPNNAVRWVYGNKLFLTEIEYGGGTINRYASHDSLGNPHTVTLAAGQEGERTIQLAYHPQMSTPIRSAESCLPNTLGSTEKTIIWDYDDPAAPGDSPDVYNQSPTRLLRRIIEKGYTRNDDGAPVRVSYITTYSYDSNGKGLVCSIDGAIGGVEDTTSFTYDGATSDLLTITRPHVGTMSLRYRDASGLVDKAGLAREMTDINGRVWSFAYDGRARLTRIEHNSDGGARSFAFNKAGFLGSITDEDGVTTTYEYDPAYGRLLRIRDEAQNTIEYGYDDQGNPVRESTIKAGSSTPSTEKLRRYDHPTYPGLLWQEISAANSAHYTEYQYHPSGLIQSIRDPNGNLTRHDYYPLGHLKTTTEPGELITAFAYDPHGNLSRVTDARGLQTLYSSDDFGRLVEVSSPDTGLTQYSYNAVGKLKTKLDANGIKVTYNYDNLYRLLRVSFPQYSNRDPYTLRYTYDEHTNGKGHLSTVEDLSGTTSLYHDARGRLYRSLTYINGVSYDYRRIHTAAGRTDFEIYPSGRRLYFERATACQCQVSRIYTTVPNQQPVTLMDITSYLPFGGADGLDVSNGGSVANSMDEDGRLKIANPGASKEHTFDYFPDGKLKGIGSSKAPELVRGYLYHDTGELQQATNPVLESFFEYDATGNRRKLTEKGVTTVYTYPAGSNRLTGFESSAGKTTYLYDSCGNTKRIDAGLAGCLILAYTQNNEISQVSKDGSLLVRYVYDGLGRRASKIKDGVRTNFVYNFEGRIIAEGSDTERVQAEYFYWGSSLLAKVDRPANTISFYHNDQLGTPQLMTNSTNTVVWQALYKPFGEATVHSGSTITNNIRFPGQYFDAETGLHYNWHRYYDPRTGRYLSPDPIGLAGGINPYVYVGGDPINRTDPLGLLYAEDHQLVGLSDPLPQELVDLPSGFGDGVSRMLTFGLYSTADLRNSLGIGGVNTCSGGYTGSKYAGYAWGVGTLWAAGLNGGSNSVFWSGYGQGAQKVAAGLGTTLEQTIIGRTLGYLQHTLGINVPNAAWRAASWTFASNASRTATAVIRSQGPIWINTELPRLLARGITIIYR